MKKLLVLIGLFCAALFVFSNRSEISEDNLKVVEKSARAMKMARLYASPAEKKVPVPVEGVRVRQIADTWGAPRSGGRGHQGQDIFAPRGTPVFSATEGIVYRVGESNLGGKTVWVVSAGGRVYYYAHLDKYAPELAVGDFVTPETVLGFVGNTGNAKGTPPHLHFGVYAGGGAINPLPLLEDRM